MAQQQSIISDPNFEIITTMCYFLTLPANANPSAISNTSTSSTPEIDRCYLLSFGLNRLRAAASAFSWPAALATLNAPNRLATLAREISDHVSITHGKGLDPTQRFIVRVAVRHGGEMSILSGPRPTAATIYFPTILPPPHKMADSNIPKVSLRMDPGWVQKSPLTTYKTTYREEYNKARQRVGVLETAGFADGEVLLTNEEEEVMGGCFSTVYFHREGRWVTPRAESGCKVGVSRRWAVECAGVEESMIQKEEVREGEVVWLSSAVGGFCWGVVTEGIKAGEKG